MSELASFIRGRKNIIFRRTINPGSENPSAPEEEEKRTCHEKPLPELDSALQALRPVAVFVGRHEKKALGDIVITGLDISYTKHGTRAVLIKYSLSTDTAISGTPEKKKAGYFRIDPPGDGESGSVAISEAHCELVKTALRECERYTEGERSQQLLDFDDDQASEGINALATKGKNKDQGELAGV